MTLEQTAAFFSVLDFNLVANYLFVIEGSFFESAKLSPGKY